MGSKKMCANQIISFINPFLKKDNWYIEPFCGGCSIIARINGNRLGSDIDEDLICLWKAVSQGWLPPETFTEDEYYSIKKQSSSPLKGYVAFALSFGGKKFGGWCRCSNKKRDYVKEAYNSAIKQFPKLHNVVFKNESYQNLEIFDNSVIYCDPPYIGTTVYSSSKEFNHTVFWEWVRNISKKNIVFVSEYNAPKDFTSIWNKEVVSDLSRRVVKNKKVEKLFIFNDTKEIILNILQKTKSEFTFEEYS